MKKINIDDVEESAWSSPSGKFGGTSKEISIALGRDPESTDLRKRHPFDVEISRIAPGKSPCPYHSHSAQTEFYLILSGIGEVRDESGTTRVVAGDAMLFEPGQAHQITNCGEEDLVFYVIADNPIGESWYYPDSNKWGVALPERKFIRSEALDYYDGEDSPK